MHCPKVLERVDFPEQIFHRRFSLGAPDNFVLFSPLLHAYNLALFYHFHCDVSVFKIEFIVHIGFFFLPSSKSYNVCKYRLPSVRYFRFFVVFVHYL